MDNVIDVMGRRRMEFFVCATWTVTACQRKDNLQTNTRGKDWQPVSDPSLSVVLVSDITADIYIVKPYGCVIFKLNLISYAPFGLK